MRKITVNFLAVILSLVLVSQSFTTVAFAAEKSLFTTDTPYSRNVDEPDENSASDSGHSPELKDSGDHSAPQIVAEVPERRTETTKTFLMSDGSYMLAAYNEPVHYKDSGDEWQDIDNTLSVENPTEPTDTQQLETTAGVNRISLARTIKPEKTVSLQAGDHTISWGIDDANKTESVVDPQNADEVEPEENHNDQFLKLKKVNSEVVYRNAFPNVDLQYFVSSGSVKENIILNSRDAQKQFSETYQIDNLVAKQVNDKTINLYEPDDTKFEKAIYTISAPQMSDANGDISDDLSISIISKSQGVLKIALEASDEWLSDAGRTYPVTIDPQVETPKTASGIRDTFISSGYGYNNQAGISNTMGTLYIGNETANYNLCRILVNFTLPQFNKGDMIVGAQLNLAQRPTGLDPSTATMQINAYEMNSAWNEKTVTWNNSFDAVKSAVAGPVLDYFNVSQSTANTYNAWDITKLVKKWYSGASTNNGIVLKAENETAAARNVYYASNYPNGDAAYPYLIINFVNNAGLESYWSYHSQSAGRAGTGSVNDYTGNLVYSVPIMNTTGERAPLDFSIVYNGYQTGDHYQDNQRGLIYGWGWQGNLSQRLDPITESSGTNDTEKAKYKLLASFGYKYVYQDEDGTEHYFITDPQNSAKVIDEDGLGMEVTKNGTADDYYTITYSDGSKKSFTSSGYLRSISDSEGNSLKLSYYGAYLTQVEDGAGRITKIDRSEYGSITGVTGPDGKQTTFNYYGGNLTSITYPDDKSIQFTYNANNQIEKAINVDGTYVKYTYFPGSNPMVQNRVDTVAEYSAGGVVGNTVSFSYNNDNSTTFQYIKSGQTKAQAQTETYNFDNVGRTISVVNMDGSAGNYKYTDTSTKDATANKMTQQAATSAPVSNLLLDNNAELNNATWAGSNWSTPGGTFSVDSTVAYLGTKSLKITQNQTSPARSGAVQKLTNLTPGTVYTLSAYEKTSGVTMGQGANLYVSFFNGSTSLGTVNGKGLSGDNDWQRNSVTFTVPTGTTRTEVYCGLSYANGTAWFDCLQLETGSVMNLYNMLENSDFRYSTNYLPDRWSVTNFESGDGMSGGQVRIAGNPKLNKNIYQNVYINKPANSIAFVVSGQSTGSSVPTHRDGRYYAIDVGMYFTDGTSQWESIIDFNPDANGTQYTSGAVAASKVNQNKTISRLEYYVIYYKNANEAKFKFLQLNMDETATNYAYDAKTGKLVSSTQNAKNTGTYAYSDAKELTSATTSNDAAGFSQNYTYTYDTNNKHRLTASRSSQTGIGFAFGYDSYGNVTDTQMGTVSTTGTLDTSQPYLESTQTYTDDGNYVKEATDQRGNTTSYDVDPVTGLTNSVEDPNGGTTEYSYNEDTNLLESVRSENGGQTVENLYAYDEADRLNKITHNGFDYTFARDGFGNTTIINVGSQNLITNIFASGNGNLLSANYGNGFKLGYFYDGYDRVTSVTKNGATAYLYTYDARGNLAKLTDRTGGSDLVTDYSYDVGDRLIKKSTSDGSTIQYSYDNMNRNTVTRYTFADQSKTSSYVPGVDNRKSEANLLSGGRVTYTYDELNREVVTDTNTIPRQEPTFRLQRSYVDVDGDANRTTSLVKTLYNYKHVGASDTTLAKYSYTYDNNGNISTVTDKDNKVTTYAYDKLNQLIRADDEKANKSTAYSYDAGGNITNVSTYAYTAASSSLGEATKSVNYEYGNENWKDLLTSYDGQSITYDAIGNPLTYRDGMNFTWEGHQLKTAVANGKNISYTYNSDGIRIGKTVDGTATKYFVDGSTVLAQQTGSDVLWFLYESDGTRVGFTYNGASYYYTKNAQGDVTGITDSNANLVVEYSYDAWGRLLSTTGSMADTIGKINPFLYRGYYYDAESGLYYLNSRYYDPQTGRMINADHIDTLTSSPTSSTDKNLFSYCDNDPVNRIDQEGSFWNIIAGAAIGALVGGISQVASNWITGNKLNDGLGVAMVTGALTGALAATGVGLIGMIVGGAAISMAGNAANQIIKNKGLSKFDAGDMVYDGAVGAATGALGGAGKGSKNLTNLGKQTIKRTANTLKYKGVSATIKELPKITSYYAKNTSYFYKPLTKSALPDTLISIGTTYTTEKLKQKLSTIGW
ncbi:DNRLRE domain-containing protein [Caproiciproducens sp. LBM24188]